MDAFIRIVAVAAAGSLVLHVLFALGTKVMIRLHYRTQWQSFQQQYRGLAPFFAFSRRMGTGDYGVGGHRWLFCGVVASAVVTVLACLTFAASILVMTRGAGP